jgi:MoxR-vWA-beta-propeller ternary system domain bpX4
MAGFAEFLKRLLTEGAAVLRDRPSFDAQERSQATAVLERAYANARLHVAGPLLDFDAPTALAAAEVVWLAGWFLLVRNEESDEVEKGLRLPEPTRHPGRHLSADLTLRYLPQIYQRARSIAADDVLTHGLARILQQWPLSGVLAALDDGPTTPLDALNHPGLFLLYAERLAEHASPAALARCGSDWTPRQGLAREWVERVFAERGFHLAE